MARFWAVRPFLHHILQSRDEKTDANTGGAFGNIGPVLPRPRGASNVQMHPGSIAHKFLQERATDNRAGLTAVADISNVGKIALDLLAVLLKQGQLPHPLSAGVPSGAQPV